MLELQVKTHILSTLQSYSLPLPAEVSIDVTKSCVSGVTKNDLHVKATERGERHNLLIRCFCMSTKVLMLELLVKTHILSTLQSYSFPLPAEGSIDVS